MTNKQEIIFDAAIAIKAASCASTDNEKTNHSCVRDAVDIFLAVEDAMYENEALREVEDENWDEYDVDELDSERNVECDCYNHYQR